MCLLMMVDRFGRTIGGLDLHVAHKPQISMYYILSLSSCMIDYEIINLK